MVPYAPYGQAKRGRMRPLVAHVGSVVRLNPPPAPSPGPLSISITVSRACLHFCVALTPGLYSATKFAVRGMCDSLRQELAPFRISVTTMWVRFSHLQW